jgi:hypothetical protein
MMTAIRRIKPRTVRRLAVASQRLSGPRLAPNAQEIMNVIQNTEELFDFYYRIEIYVPKGKRRNGYYKIPILHGDQIIGRIYPKMVRKKKQLVINEIHVEPSAPKSVDVIRAIAGSLEKLASFLGAKEIVLIKKPPYGWRSGLRF